MIAVPETCQEMSLWCHLYQTMIQKMWNQDVQNQFDPTSSVRMQHDISNKWIYQIMAVFIVMKKS